MAESGNKASGDAGRCGYPAATTGNPCRRRPLAGKQRCLEHADKPGAPRGNENAVTHGAYRRADLVLLDATDEELEVFERARSEDPTDLMIGALFVEYRRFLRRTTDDETRTQGFLIFAEQARKLAEARAKIRAADKTPPDSGKPQPGSDVVAAMDQVRRTGAAAAVLADAGDA